MEQNMKVVLLRWEIMFIWKFSMAMKAIMFSEGLKFQISSQKSHLHVMVSAMGILKPLKNISVILW